MRRKKNRLRFFLTIVLFFISFIAFAQKDKQEVFQQMKHFHKLMVQQKFFIDQYLDDSLTYGHSNGWVENKKEFLSNLGNKIVYHSIKEDSIHVSVNKKIAHARFIATIDATLDGKQNRYLLKVLEVWVKKGKKWKFFARQAIKG
jgi:hypothetical protein